MQCKLLISLHKCTNCRNIKPKAHTETCFLFMFSLCCIFLSRAKAKAESVRLSQYPGSIYETKASRGRVGLSVILSTGTRIQIDSVMRPRSSSRGRNTSASVTVTVTVTVCDRGKAKRRRNMPSAKSDHKDYITDSISAKLLNMSYR